MKKIALGFALLAALPSRAATLTYEDLVGRLTNMEAVATLPLPGEKGALASSYDRASQFDAATGKYVKWDANGDGRGIIRKDGELEVMAEITGPGCIWRIWSATVGDGRVKIYLDGAEQPAVDLPFKNYFDHSSAPFNYPALVYKTAANGYDSYVPISFQKSCKIVAEKNWGNYFQFTYTTFPAGTVVPTFRRELGDKEKAALEAANKALSDNLGTDPAPRAGEQTISANITAPAGGTATVAKIETPRAITGLRVKVDAAALENGAQALREAVLVMRWDDEKTPAVWVPLGDFFGAAPGYTKYKSLPLGMTDEGMYSFWYMPFRKAHIEVLNEGKTPLPLQFTIKHAPLTEPIENLARFHAKWHRDNDLPAEPERKIDWTLLRTQGKGRFAGVMLHVWNPRGGWWGEGDEKFFVDGEKFPSTIGTGSEDYFGYAWSSMKTFAQALHNQPNVDGKSGNNSVQRWHIADNVPFQTSFDGYIEKYFPNNRPTLFTTTVYWYLASGGTDPYGAVPLAQRIGYYSPMPPQRVPGNVEGEMMKVLEVTGGKANEQGLASFGDKWSGASHLWWTGAKPGDKLTLAVPVAADGKYALKAQFTKAKDYGIIQLYLDGRKIGEPMDFFSATVVPTGEVSLGEFILTSGDHKFTAEVVGANEQAIKSYMFGLDYLKADVVK